MSEPILMAGERLQPSLRQRLAEHGEETAQDAYAPNDYRWVKVGELNADGLDAEMVRQRTMWVQNYLDLADAIEDVHECKSRLKERRKSVRQRLETEMADGTEKEIKGGSAAERVARWKILVDDQPNVRAILDELEDAERGRRRQETLLEIAGAQMSDLRQRMGFAKTRIDFFRTVERIPMEQAPDQDGVLPWVDPSGVKTTGDVPFTEEQQVVMRDTQEAEKRAVGNRSQATVDWLASMANEDTRYSPFGQLALVGLPSGVNGEDPKVLEVLADIQERTAGAYASITDLFAQMNPGEMRKVVL